MSPRMHVTAIIAAGGRGQRLGGPLPKQLLSVGGRTLLDRAVAIFVIHPHVDDVVVALPSDLAADPPSFLVAGPKPVRIVAGGARRQDSVFNAFQAVGDLTDIVVVHDAARPFATADLITRTILAAAEWGAALAALPSRDTVKRALIQGPDAAVGDEAGLFVAETLPRETIFLAQTPQAFRRDVLRDAFASSEPTGEATDEASLAERAGYRVRVVEGEPTNIKITTREDLWAAEAILQSRGHAPRGLQRVGTGYDLHRLVNGRKLILGGVAVDADRGALGHSDADVVCHAITDAILGAAALGDIGRHFPETDARWKDASSLDLLSRAAALVADHGYEIGNVDATVILESPRIGGHIDLMRTTVARVLGIDRRLVSIKAKTNEGMDATGRGEAIAAHGVALLRTRE